MSRIDVLKNSLEKKQDELDRRLGNHFADVASANGQPLNDKRNGQATLNRWDRQCDAIRNQIKEVEKTEDAIQKEEWKIANIAKWEELLPAAILKAVQDGRLTQWRKYPNTFFIPGVDKARIVWTRDDKHPLGGCLGVRYWQSVSKEQYPKLLGTFNQLKAEINQAD